MAPRLVLFDLDGTLADTAPDIARVTNRVLLEADRPPLPLEAVRACVSLGARVLLQSGFDAPLETSQLARLQDRLFAYYTETPMIDTVVFAGLHALIERLATAGIHWGIVSNKPEALVRPIMTALAFSPDPVCIVGGDTFSRKKPDPLPLIEACRLAGIPPADSVYVGDAHIDAEAARAAGMPLIVAGYGYAPSRETVKDWGDVHYAADAGELATLIGVHLCAPVGVA